MAFKKIWTDESTGVTGYYWELISFHYDQASGQSDVCHGVWVDEQAFKDGKSQIHNENTSVQSDIISKLIELVKQTSMEEMKKTDFLKDAEEVKASAIEIKP